MANVGEVHALRSVYSASAVNPPTTEAELLNRAHALAGRTIGDIANELNVTVSPDPRRTKGLVGQLLERALGASAGSRDEPDFLELGVELKTLPIVAGRPKESTFVCTIKLNEMEDTDWEASLAWRKLRRVLWIPVEADRAKSMMERHIGAPILWTPSDEQRRALQDDWERVATLIANGEVDTITGHLGTYLQVRPKAAHGGVRKRAPDADGAFQWTNPKGFYLRTQLTEQILREFERSGS